MVEQLKEHVEKNDLMEKTIEGFWVAFHNYRNECRAEDVERLASISASDLAFVINDVGLRASEWPECTYSHVTIKITVEHEGKRLAYYTCWFPLGDDVSGDDFLEIW